MNRPGRVGRARRGSVRAVGLLAATWPPFSRQAVASSVATPKATSYRHVNQAAAGPLEKSTLTVGVMLGIDCAGAQLALLNDAFEEEGLTIKPETVQSGAIAIPKLAGRRARHHVRQLGVLHEGASGRAVDMRFISESYISTPNSNFAVIAGPDSGINSAKDLAGKKIAVNAHGNINELLLRAVFEANDVDFNSRQPRRDAVPGDGRRQSEQQVDAAALIDPFMTRRAEEHRREDRLRPVPAGPDRELPAVRLRRDHEVRRGEPEHHRRVPAGAAQGPAARR